MSTLGGDVELQKVRHARDEHRTADHRRPCRTIVPRTDAGPEADLDAEQILSHDIVVPAYAQPERIQHIHIYRNGKASATVSDREGVAFLILTGCFIGLLPTHYAHQWVATDTMRRLLPGEFSFVSQ
ncbi:hypothetical protein GCT13_41560 [Paraburkholderia sp. CNPSo 3157]|uniref:Uncharacterized protein n=1 Tax=Paraburkholderia franconis TaxID=2654983 RepID=A0A7X1NJH0_9BURK|nr:hypothetical protein [Paraburkholderia franconis]MPW23090.1 hypothetical protein [Paraburkholderia franconis]